MLKLDIARSFILCLFTATVFGQGTVSNRPKNNLALNFIGDGSIISLNYDRLFPITDYLMFDAKVGLGYAVIPTFSNSASERFLTLPNHVSLLAGKGSHFFELGLGSVIISGDVHPNFIPYPQFGYRLASRWFGNLSLRIYLNFPLYPKEEIETLFLPFGISIGVSF